MGTFGTLIKYVGLILFCFFLSVMVRLFIVSDLSDTDDIAPFKNTIPPRSVPDRWTDRHYRSSCHITYIVKYTVLQGKTFKKIFCDNEY